MTTATTTLPRRDLPTLRRDQLPLVVESLGGPLSDVSRQRREAFAAAVKLRAKAADAWRAVEKAAEKDRQAFRAAAIDDKPDPGRTYELKATREAEQLHREAEGATLRANSLAAELREAIAGKPGEQQLEEANSRIDKALEALTEHLTPVDDDLATLAALTAALEQIEATRKPGISHIPGGRGPEVGGLKQIHVNGGGNGPAHLVALLREYDPRREQ
jgi:hypothetical protein